MNALTLRMLYRDFGVLGALITPTVAAVAYRAALGDRKQAAFAVASLILVGAVATGVASFIAFRLSASSEGTGSPLALFLAPRPPFRLVGDWVVASVLCGIVSVLPLVPFVSFSGWPGRGLFVAAVLSILLGAAVGVFWAMNPAAKGSESTVAILPAGGYVIATGGAIDAAWSAQSFYTVAAIYVVGIAVVLILVQRRLRKLCASSG